MDLKVYVEGVLREVCGVTDNTTCEEIIVKLAQAANLPGFYILVAVYRSHEDTLSADERMGHFFQRIKDKPDNVRFVLRRLEAPSPRPDHPKLPGTGQATSLNNGVYSRWVPTAPRSHVTEPVESRNACSPRIAPPPHRSTQKAVGQHSQMPRRSTALENEWSTTNANVVSHTQVELELGDYEYLEDQLAYQEQEVELNRIRLLHLDQAIAELERANRLSSIGNTTTAVGPAAELAQLNAAPWPQLLEANRSRQTDLLKEREHHQSALDRLNAQLELAQKETSDLEAKVKHELSHLLNVLDSANAQRRQLLRSLSPTSIRPRPSPSSATDGVPV